MLYPGPINHKIVDLWVENLGIILESLSKSLGQDSSLYFVYTRDGFEPKISEFEPVRVLEN